jgi:hypothetical protein
MRIYREIIKAHWRQWRATPEQSHDSMEFTTPAEGKPWRKAVKQVRRCYLSIDDYVLRASGKPASAGPTRLLAPSTLNGSYLAFSGYDHCSDAIPSSAPCLVRLAASGRPCGALGQLQLRLLSTTNLHFLSHRLRVYLHSAVSPIRRLEPWHLPIQTHGFQLGYSASRWPKSRPATK